MREPRAVPLKPEPDPGLAERELMCEPELCGGFAMREERSELGGVGREGEDEDEAYVLGGGVAWSARGW